MNIEKNSQKLIYYKKLNDIFNSLPDLPRFNCVGRVFWRPSFKFEDIFDIYKDLNKSLKEDSKIIIEIKEQRGKINWV